MISPLIKLAVIGAGNIAAGHLRRFLEMSRVDVVGLADPSNEAIATIQEKVEGLAGVPTYADWSELLSAVNPSAVLVATPHTLHHEHVMGSLDAGAHVLCEKPLAHTPELAHEIAEHAVRQSRHVVVSFQRRFSPGYRYMRFLLARGNLGEMTHIQATQAQEWLVNTAGTWRQSMTLGGGGQLSDSGSHLIDILLWTTGLRVIEVDARTREYGKEVEVDGAATLLFDNGAIGTLSIIGSGHTFWERLSITATEGVLRADWASGGTEVITREDARTQTTNTVTDLPDGTNPDAHFVEVLNGDSANDSPPEESVHLLEVVAAIRRSAALGRREYISFG